MFKKYTCDTCGKSKTVIHQNNKGLLLPRCSMTLNCIGKLFEDGTSLTSVKNLSILDASSNNKEINDLNLIYNKRLYLGYNQDAESIALNYRIDNDVVQSFKKYSFKLDKSFLTISGQESFEPFKILQYDLNQTLEIYFNGIKLDKNLYQVFDGNNNLVENTIVFNQIMESGLYEVVVSDEPQFNQIELYFIKQDDKKTILDHLDSLSEYKIYSLDVVGESTLIYKSLNLISVLVDGIVQENPTCKFLILDSLTNTLSDINLTTLAEIDKITVNKDLDYVANQTVNIYPPLVPVYTTIPNEVNKVNQYKYNISNTLILGPSP